MRLTLCPLYSSSSGNCTYFSCGGIRMLVDAGVSASKIKEALEEIGVDIRDIDGILVTHEHSDHIKGLAMLSKKYRLPICANEGTWKGILAKAEIAPDCRRLFVTGEDFYIGQINVFPFPIPHDTIEPVGFSFTCGALKWSIATDIGHLNETWLHAVSGSQALLLEANHDPAMVEAGSYPAMLKKRILGKKGHLSNSACAEALLRLMPTGVQAVILAHLSPDNNIPELAYDTVSNALIQNGYKIEEDIHLTVARRDKVSDMLVLEC